MKRFAIAVCMTCLGLLAVYVQRSFSLPHRPIGLFAYGLADAPVQVPLESVMYGIEPGGRIEHPHGTVVCEVAVGALLAGDCPDVDLQALWEQGNTLVAHFEVRNGIVWLRDGISE